MKVSQILAISTLLLTFTANLAIGNNLDDAKKGVKSTAQTVKKGTTSAANMSLDYIQKQQKKAKQAVEKVLESPEAQKELERQVAEKVTKETVKQLNDPGNQQTVANAMAAAMVTYLGPETIAFCGGPENALCIAIAVDCEGIVLQRVSLRSVQLLVNVAVNQKFDAKAQMKQGLKDFQSVSVACITAGTKDYLKTVFK